MSRLPITAYFNTRKRQMCDKLRGKSKVLLLERDYSSSPALIIADDSKQIAPNEKDKRTTSSIVWEDASTEGICINKAIRNIQFNSSTVNLEKTPNRLGTPAMRSHVLSATDGSQPNIRDSLLKASRDSKTKKVPFAKMDMFSPEKNCKLPRSLPKDCPKGQHDRRENDKEQLSASNCPLIPLSSDLMMERLANRRDEQLLELLQKQDAIKEPQIQKFEKMELEGSTRRKTNLSLSFANSNQGSFGKQPVLRGEFHLNLKK